MAVVEMKKLAIIGLTEEKDRILKVIQQLGNIELCEKQLEEIDVNQVLKSQNDEVTLDKLEIELARTRTAIDLLKPWSTVKKGMFTPKKMLNMDELEAFMQDNQAVQTILNQCEAKAQELSNCRTNETRFQSTVEQVTPWKTLTMDVESIHATKETEMCVGFMPSVASEVDQMPDGLALSKVGEQRDVDCVFVIYHKAIAEEAVAWLKQHQFDRYSFQGVTGTPDDILRNVETKLKQNENQLHEAHEQLKQLAENLEILEMYHDGLTIEVDKALAANTLRGTQETFMLNGWIPDEAIESFNVALSKITNDYYAWFKKPEKGEIFPVLLDNPTAVQPFEMVTGLYSTPSSNEIDPNKIMAPFFFIFFGMMLSDAGYGIILAIAGALFARKLGVKPSDRTGTGKLIWLIAIGGISTFLWGAFFGSWFGDISILTGGWKIKPLGFDPQAEPILMLGLCFALGIVHLFVGMGMDAYKSIKKGKVLDAIYDQGLWYVLIIGLVMLAIPQTAIIGKWLSIGGVAGLILTQGRTQTGILKKLFSGVGSLYGLTGYLSDILSYSRLFALGLATGVIATVINQLASMLGGSIVGTIFMAVILVGGHMFNIVINVLGSFVHSSRLQYIEFFGKFFEGGGHAFNPLRIKTKFVTINNKEAL
jgi:V/A-type H+-transporting ATPase subunit I